MTAAARIAAAAPFDPFRNIDAGGVGQKEPGDGRGAREKERHPGDTPLLHGGLHDVRRQARQRHVGDAFSGFLAEDHRTHLQHLLDSGDRHDHIEIPHRAAYPS